MIRFIAAAALSAVLFVGNAGAATLSGTFSVTGINVTGLNSSKSRAIASNFQAAESAYFGGPAFGSSVILDNFTYAGELDFGTFDPNDGTTVAGWLATGGGTVTDLSTELGGAQLSKPNISNGTATSTFFLFVLMDDILPGDFMVRHDDGMNIFENSFDTLVGGFNGPNGVRNTTVTGFRGGVFGLLYVATNGDPSVLKVDFSPAPIPLPATLPMLLAGFAGMVLVRRRARA